MAIAHKSRNTAPGMSKSSVEVIRSAGICTCDLEPRIDDIYTRTCSLFPQVHPSPEDRSQAAIGGPVVADEHRTGAGDLPGRRPSPPRVRRHWRQAARESVNVSAAAPSDWISLLLKHDVTLCCDATLFSDGAECKAWEESKAGACEPWTTCPARNYPAW